MSILRCGEKGEIDFDDVQQKNTNWGWRAKLKLFKHGVIANDLMVQVFITADTMRKLFNFFLTTGIKQ
jgi:hypothetical protein